jgi:fused signal recognition particle receptor
MGLFDWLKKNNNNENVENTEVSESVETTQAAENEEAETVTENTETEEATEEEASVEETPIAEEVESVIEETAQETEEVEEIEPIFKDTEKEVEEEKSQKMGFFAKIKQGLTKTRENILSGVEEVLKSFKTIDEDMFEELEEALVMADIGMETSMQIIEKLREKIKAEKIKDAELVKPALIEVISDMLKSEDDELKITPPTVILVIGVNGVGKTTTIGKLAHNFTSQGRSVMLAAADTFRAAAIDQLEIWGERNNVPVIKHQENSDPGAVVFDAVKAAKARGIDVLICDTAGRLHNKKNLMDELKKISKIIGREYSEAQVETLLVLDSTTGQNAVQQAKLFNEAADITGIVLTKLDGTAKGGIVIAIKNELNIPVRYIGVGEGIDDLQPFDSMAFSSAIFGEE